MRSVNDVLEAAAEPMENPPSERLRQALGRLVALSDDEKEIVHLRIARALPDVEAPGGAGILALWLGATVERGADPDATAGFVQETLFRWLRSLPEPPEDDAEPPSSRLSAGLLAGIQMLETSLIAHMSRSAAALLAFRKHGEARTLVGRATDWEAGGMWLREVLNQCSGELVVLHGTESKGFRVSYRNLSTCFHLFTLLQGVLQGQMPGSRKASSQTLAIARGEKGGETNDSAWWHYGQPSAPVPDLGSSVWGEGSPDSIESVEGVQVLLVWPPIMDHRGWDAGFFSPSLQSASPSVTVESELLPEEIERWRSRLGLSRNESPRQSQVSGQDPWWKFWN